MLLAGVTEQARFPPWELDTGLVLAFHSNSHVSLQERRWYIAGARATLIADLVRNRLMIRNALSRGKPERIDYGGVTSDLHNGADEAMARDLLAALSGHSRFPVTPGESMEAGLTVMAIDQSMSEASVVDCAPIWERYDNAWRPDRGT